jgi:hypothetical protein
MSESLDSSFSIVTGLWAVGLVLRFPKEAIFFLSNVHKDLKPTETPVEWVQGAVSSGIKRPGREANLLPPFSVVDKNAWSYTAVIHICLHSVERDFTFSVQVLPTKTRVCECQHVCQSTARHLDSVRIPSKLCGRNAAAENQDKRD